MRLSMRRVVIVAFPGCPDAGRARVRPRCFHTADPLRAAGAYEVDGRGAGAGPLRTSTVTLVPDRTARLAASGPIDTLVVAGGTGVRAARGATSRPGRLAARGRRGARGA